MWQIIDIVVRELIKSFVSLFTVYYLGKIFLRRKKQKITKVMIIGILISLIFYTIICLNVNGMIKTVLLSVINI